MDIQHTREWFISNRSYYYNNKDMICVNCGSTDNLHLHHIVPLALGGTNNLGNVSIVCGKCHGKIHGAMWEKHGELIKQGLENARAEGKELGRPKTTTDDIPHIFLKHYPKYANKDINVSEFARMCNMSRPTIYKYIKLVQQ